MFFETISNSWSYAKTSYRIVWDHKRLIVFPILSGIASLLVIASFMIPLWQTGTLETWLESSGSEAQDQGRVGMYVTGFLFYFCNYLVIIFFNSALIASTMQVVKGESPSLAYGLAAAGKRLPQIVGWALISAVVGVLLKAVENSSEKAGRFISAILGTAWTAMAYFVVPVIVIDGVGPIKAFKQSLKTIRQTWGTALVGTFSLGLLGFLLMLPIFLVAGVLVFCGIATGSVPLRALCFVVAVALVIIGWAGSSAADTIFKALLFSYTNERSSLSGIDTSDFGNAFRPRD